MSTRALKPDLEALDPHVVVLDERVAEVLDDAEEDRLQRLETDRFSFPDDEAFRRFRRARGLR